MATFTMLTSRMDMNIPPISTASGMRQAVEDGPGTALGRFGCRSG
jgi:hypothetical protein